MITSSTSAWIASVIARKSSISKLGTPSGVRAWMWICTPPSSTIRRASAAYSSGVYGIAGHWSRLAIAPEIEQLMITGSEKRLTRAPPRARETEHRGRQDRQLAPFGRYASEKRHSGRSRASYRHDPMFLVRPLDTLVLRHSQAADDRRAGLARVDDVIDDVV